MKQKITTYKKSTRRSRATLHFAAIRRSMQKTEKVK
jgi:hypothetical protein